MSEMIINKSTSVGISTILKRCSKCGQKKPLSQYYRDKRAKDGKYSSCKMCDGVACKKWYAKNPEKAKEKNRKWRAKNPEKAKENSRKWYAKNPEKAKENSRKWRAKDPEKAKENSRKWYAKNPEKAKEYNRKCNNIKVSELKDTYIKSLLKAVFKNIGLETNDITPEMIELKRNSLLFYRTRKKIERRLKDGTNGAQH